MIGSLISFVMFIALFLGLCVGIVLFIAIYNIISKSYQPRNALLVMIPLLILLLISTFLAVVNMLSLAEKLKGYETQIFTTY